MNRGGPDMPRIFSRARKGDPDLRCRPSRWREGPSSISSRTGYTPPSSRLCPPRTGRTFGSAQGWPSCAGTSIRHVIIGVSETHTFDNVFGTCQPKGGQKIGNLLAKGSVNAGGTPGPNFELARQSIGSDRGEYHAVTPSTGEYATLPQPYTTYAIGEPGGVPDTRFPTNLPNGPFQISRYVPYSAYTGDPVHRFFQMWQDVDGGRNDKFVWVEETIGTGSNGKPLPAGGFNPREGAISMGFYNMNPFTDAAGAAHSGDEPVFKALADAYAS